MKVRILAEADREVDEAREFLTDRSSGLGARFLDELAETLDQLSASPESFPKLETLGNEWAYRRARLKTFPYFLVFEVQPAEVVVVAVVHARRAPNYWLDRPV